MYIWGAQIIYLACSGRKQFIWVCKLPFLGFVILFVIVTFGRERLIVSPNFRIIEGLSFELNSYIATFRISAFCMQKNEHFKLKTRPIICKKLSFGDNLRKRTANSHKNVSFWTRIQICFGTRLFPLLHPTKALIKLP